MTPSYNSAPLFGLFGVDTAEKMALWKAAGGTHVVTQAIWEYTQPGPGQALDSYQVTQVRQQLETAAALGLKTIFEVAVHYPPAWLLAAVPPFKNQAGEVWNRGNFPGDGANAAGDNVRDWIWDAGGRGYLGDIITRWLQAIDLTKLDGIRLGGGPLGEAHFPPGTAGAPQSFWGYGDAPYLGRNLAPGMAAAPAGSRDSDPAFVEWYLDSYRRFLRWLVQQHRALYAGPLYVLQPGYGLRSNLAPDSAANRGAAGRGHDFDRLTYAYNDIAGVYPWSTWIDGNDAAFPITADSDKAAWRKLREVTVGKGLNALYGENTGGQSSADLDRIFDDPARGALRNDVRGYFHLNWALTKAGGSNAPFWYLRKKIKRLDSLQSRVLAELDSFTDWGRNQGVDLCLGEIGVPNNADVAEWGHLLDLYYEQCLASGVWTLKWASGPAWGTGYSLGDYVDTPASNGLIAAAQSQTPVLEKWASSFDGIGLSGAEFPMSGDGFNRNGFYRWPSSASIEYLAGRGVKLLRLALAWERLQPVLSAPLDPTQLASLDGVLKSCAARNIRVILDLHNYARYTLPGSTTGTALTLSGGAVNAADLGDFWSRLSQWVRADPLRDAIVTAYGLMNEPHDLAPIASPGGFSGRSLYAFGSGGAAAWVSESGKAQLAPEATITHSGSGSLKITSQPLTSGSYNLVRLNSSGAPPVLGSGTALSAYLYLPAGTASGWKARLEWQDQVWRWQSVMPMVPLAAGSWTRLSYDFARPLTLDSVRSWGIQLENNAPATSPLVAYLDDFAQGIFSAGDSKRPAQVWEAISQQVVTALRTAGDSRTILVPGYEWSHTHNWASLHPAHWIVDPASNIRYEAHHYWDLVSGRSGTYPASYAAEVAASEAAGY